MRHLILIGLIAGLFGCAAAPPPPTEAALPREVPETSTLILADCKDPGGRTVVMAIIVTYPSGVKITIDDKHLYGFSGANDAAHYASAAEKQRVLTMECPSG